jgi:hypothetical protein
LDCNVKKIQVIFQRFNHLFALTLNARAKILNDLSLAKRPYAAPRGNPAPQLARVWANFKHSQVNDTFQSQSHLSGLGVWARRCLCTTLRGG